MNLAHFGNPLFPLDLEIAGLRLLPGAIPFEAVAGQFYATPWKLVSWVLPTNYGWVACGLTAIGSLALLTSALAPGPRRPARLVLAGVAVYWALFYFFRLLHNTETRFLLLVVCLALVGWAWLLEPLRRRNRWLARAA